MKIGDALTVFAASIAIAAYGISVAKENEIVSALVEKYNVEKTEAVATAESYILQGNSIEAIQAKLKEVGANASQNFPIINAVSATLTPDQVKAVKASGDFRVQADRTVMTMAASALTASSPYAIADEISVALNNQLAQLTNASGVHKALGQKGDRSIGIMIVDSGVDILNRENIELRKDSSGLSKHAAPFNALTNRRDRSAYTDTNGHGTHVASIMTSNIIDVNGDFNGMAPDVRFMSIKAFDEDGKGSYSTVLAALNHIYQNVNLNEFRVLNLSIGAPATSHYWEDPINQAVTQLWSEGVVVVTSAGNNGEQLGITVPGNNPYVITVGAMTDNGTLTDFSDDRIASFSSRGPTYEGFIKPDLVAPGTSIAVKMANNNLKAQGLRQHDTNSDYYTMSGTSQAAAVVSGVAALVLSQDPTLSADDVKCRIVSSARPAFLDNKLTFSPFEQGAGLVDAYTAVTSTMTGCANQGLDIEADLAEELHFIGPAMPDGNGGFYIELPDGGMLTEGAHWGGSVNTLGAHWGGSVTMQGAHWGGSVNTQGAHWGGSVNTMGAHWGGSMTLQGAHWGGSVNLQGAHWGGSISVQGAHWGGSVSLQGAHWGGSVNTMGAHWGGSVILQGAHWGGSVLLQGEYWGSESLELLNSEKEVDLANDPTNL